MIQAICTLHFPFVVPMGNRVTPNSPCIGSSLPQNATLHNSHTLCLVLRIQGDHDNSKSSAMPMWPARQVVLLPFSSLSTFRLPEVLIAQSRNRLRRRSPEDDRRGCGKTMLVLENFHGWH